jgi:hypothetical protein
MKPNSQAATPKARVKMPRKIARDPKAMIPSRPLVITEKKSKIEPTTHIGITKTTRMISKMAPRMIEPLGSSQSNQKNRIFKENCGS